MAQPPASSGSPTIPTVRSGARFRERVLVQSRTRDHLECRIQPAVRTRTFQRSVHWQCWKEPLDHRVGRPRDDASLWLRCDGRLGCSRPIHHQRPRASRGQFSAAGVLRVVLNPARSMANVAGGRSPWYRVSRPLTRPRQSAAHRQATRPWNSDATKELERRGIERGDRSWWRGVDRAPRCHASHTRPEPLESSTMVGPFSHAAIVL